MVEITIKLDDTKLQQLILQQFGQIRSDLAGIKEKVVMLQDELDTLVTSIDEATNAVAAQIDKLRSEIAAALANPNVLTDAAKASILARLQAASDRLVTLGADPANPVPPEPPPPPPPA